MSASANEQLKSDAEELWRRVGLEQLRAALARTGQLMVEFEHVLQGLPSCTECARSQLISQLRQQSSDLSVELGGLAILAKGLQEAVAEAEAARGELLTRAPSPCRCQGDPCTCHSK